MDEVLAPAVSLVGQCAKGILFNWSRHLCQEFLTNCCEAQDETKPFDCTQLLLYIVLVTWGLLEDNQFPLLEEGFLEAVWFTSLWDTKDPICITETKIFWVLKEVRLHMAVNQWPRLSPNSHTQLSTYVDFIADFHRFYIQAQKDPTQKWYELPYLVTDSDVQDVVSRWLAECCTPSDLADGPSTSTYSVTAKKIKEVAKKAMQNLDAQ